MDQVRDAAAIHLQEMFGQETLYAIDGAPARHVRASAVSTLAPSSSVGWRQVASVGRFPVWINAHSFSYARDSARGAGGTHGQFVATHNLFPLLCASMCLAAGMKTRFGTEVTR